MNIFVTGAAGLIGGELIAKLLDSGHAVVGLVRSNADVRSNTGAKLTARPFDGNLPGAGELSTIHGDVKESGLGLEPTVGRFLTNHIDLVIHCAALTAFDADREIQQAINVQGTGNVLAMFSDKAFLHVSTAYTCGLQNSRVPESLHGPDTRFMNGYEQSKAEAEKLVFEKSDNFVIARPSIVVGEHETGRIKSFDTIYAVFRLIAEGRISTLPADTNASLDFVPIDHVVSGLIDIVDHWDTASGQVFHLSSGNPVAPQTLVDAIGSFDQLSKPNLIASAQFSPDDLSPRERRLYKMTASHYASYFARNPEFETKNLTALSNRTCPIMDQATLQRMISYCIEAGFLGGRKAAVHRISG